MFFIEFLRIQLIRKEKILKCFLLQVHESRLLPKNIEIAYERLKYALDRHVNGDECYEEQYKRLQREKEAKAKRKRELHRRQRSEAEGMKESPNSE
ncbi:unnamed protein product [Haemonchus placei]|uniref:Uncharacterized protein n=1 Tax=Haemonchus placei TaxID=6290 RepID=A0A0N4W547_HAEPC|nr:unnamed protein product [Haemonchus placei]